MAIFDSIAEATVFYKSQTRDIRTLCEEAFDIRENKYVNGII
jgi:hypothetical protein